MNEHHEMNSYIEIATGLHILAYIWQIFCGIFPDYGRLLVGEIWSTNFLEFYYLFELVGCPSRHLLDIQRVSGFIESLIRNLDLF